jgi:hypothetical protein
MVSTWLDFNELSSNVLIIIVAYVLNFDSVYIGNDFVVIVIDFVFGFRS